MIDSNSSRLKRYLWQIAIGDPRYRSFVQAQNIDITEVSSNKKNKYDYLMEHHGDRIDKYYFYLSLYYGNHWFHISDENLDPIVANYCAVSVNKHTAFLMNKGFKAISDFPEIEKYLNDNWMFNSSKKDSNLFGTELSLTGGITGDVFFDIKQSVHPDYKVEYTKFDIIDSVNAFPIYEGKNTLLGFLKYGLEQYVTRLNNGFADYDERFEGYFYNNKGEKKIIINDKVVDTEQYALTEMPVVHIKNFASPTMPYGLSDLLSFSDLNLVYNRISTDIQDIIDYHAQPVTILKGAKSTELQRGANRIWSLPLNSEISNLSLDSDLGASVDNLKRIRETIAELSNIPESAIGKQQHISNTSASALAITFMPLYETMEYKRVVYGTGLLKAQTYAIKVGILTGRINVNEIIKKSLKRWREDTAKMDERMKDKLYPFREKINENKDYNKLSTFFNNEIPPEIFQSGINWFPPLPRDDASITDLIISNVNAGIWSRKYGRTLQGISERIANQIEKDVDAEREKFAEAETIVTNKTGMEGNDDVKGKKESERKEKEANKI